MTTRKKTDVVVLYKRDGQPDQELVKFLEHQLGEEGCAVFIDRHLTMGVDWAREIEGRIRLADAVVPLLSADSIYSEMLGFEIETAHEAAQLQGGRPRILPVRVNYTGPLPEPLASILDPVQYFLWEGEHDNLGLATELTEALKHLAIETPAAEVVGAGSTGALPASPLATEITKTAPTNRPPALEAIGGAVPLDSEFYIARPADAELQRSIDKKDSIILLKGARQMGKTSMLARGLQYARQQQVKAVSTDLQKFNAESFRSLNHLYKAFAESMVNQLDLETFPADTWDERRGPNANFERFMRREVLGRFDCPLVWALDEVDRLFGTPFGNEMFGLLRSWHNDRALDPTGPWSGLTIAIAYATEAHLFITDLNQSPFNVGTRLALEDFNQTQVSELNHRYRNPLKDQDELNRFHRLVGGQPYLVRRGLHEMASRKLAFSAFEEHAARDDYFYGDHLRRILVLLVRDAELSQAMKAVLNSLPCPSSESFDRLRSAGLLIGHTREEARPRCRLYATYLRRHLL